MNDVFRLHYFISPGAGVVDLVLPHLYPFKRMNLDLISMIKKPLLLGELDTFRSCYIDLSPSDPATVELR
jgi:hypothetical protein